MNNNISVKQAVLWLFIGAIIIGGLSYFGLSPRFAGEKEYILVLDYNNGKIRKFSGKMFSETAKAWDLLQLASAQSEVSVEIEDGFVPRSIDGVKNTEKSRWVLYVNGVKQTGSPFEVLVNRGDTVEFKYEK